MTSLRGGSRVADNAQDHRHVVGAPRKIFCEDLPSADLLDRPLTVEAEFAAGAWSGYHVHPHQDESFELLSGTLEVFAEGRWKRLQRGESVRIPKQQFTAFRNSTDTVARAINTHDPGLRILEYWKGIERLIRQGKVTGMSGLGNGIYLSLLVMEFRREIVVVRAGLVLTDACQAR